MAMYVDRHAQHPRMSRNFWELKINGLLKIALVRKFQG